MIYVNILSGYKQLFIQQLDKKRYENYIEFHENSTEDRVWDYVVVYEIIRTNVKIKCKKGGLVFMSGEPEDSSPYCKKFLGQFDHVITTHQCYKGKNIHNSQTSLNFHYGYSFFNKKFKYDFDALCAMPIPQKDKPMSMICSTKTMLPGHVLRLQLYKTLRSQLEDRIDFFGDGINRIDDKAEGIAPYKFHICIENSAVKDYWTEKISDSILGYAIPIYYGATNIYEYFPKDSVIWIDIQQTDEAVHLIKEILDNADELYLNRLPALLEARKLLLNEYNIFPSIEKIIVNHPNRDEVAKIVTVKTYLNMFGYKLRMIPLRIRRFVFKKLHI